MRDYRTKWSIDDSQVKAALARTLAGYGKVEKAALSTVVAIEKSAHRSGVAWDNAATVAGRSATALASKQVKAAATAANGATQASAAGVRARVKAEESATARIGVSLEKLQLSGIKVQDALAKAAEKQASQSIKGAEKASAVALREQAAIARTAEQQAARAAKDSEKKATVAEKAAQKTVDAEIREQTKLQAALDRMTKQDYDRRVMYERRKEEAAKRGTTAVLTDEQVKAKASQQIIADTNRKRVYAEMNARGVAKSTLTQLTQAASKTAFSMVGIGTALVTSTYGLRSFGEAFEKIKDDAQEAAKATLEMRKALRVEATLKGAGQTTNKELLESIQFQVDTGLNETESSDFTRQYLGSLQTGIDKGNITDDVAKKLMKSSGVMAARQGGDKGTKGELAGILSQFGKVESEEQGLGQLEAIRIALTAGRGDDTELNKQLLKVAGSIVREGGKVGSIQEMAALIGVTSVSGGTEAAGTRAEQLNRTLSTGLTRVRKSQGMGESQSDWFKHLGVTEPMNMEQKLDLIVPDLEKAIAAGRDPVAYLREHGMASEEERRALIETSSNYVPLKKRIAESKEAGQGAKVAAQNAAFKASPEGQAATAEGLKRAALATRGLPGEQYEALQAAKASSPEIQEGDKSIWTNLKDKFVGALYASGSETGRKRRVDEATITDLEEKAKASGVTSEEMAASQRKSSNALGIITPTYYRDYGNALIAATKEHGGGGPSIEGDVKKAMKALIAALEKNTTATEKNIQPPGAGAKPVAPVLPGG